ncbi:MAG: DUF1330 domain-containing protein [Chloroflexota bacterium]
MAAYLIARVTVNDMEQYKKYMAVSPSCIERYGGKFIVRGGDKITMEGPEETNRVVIVEFSDYQTAQDCYNSLEYQEAIKLRQDAAEAQFVIVDGA